MIARTSFAGISWGCSASAPMPSIRFAVGDRKEKLLRRDQERT